MACSLGGLEATLGLVTPLGLGPGMDLSFGVGLTLALDSALPFVFDFDYDYDFAGALPVVFAAADLLPLDLALDFATPLLLRGLLTDFALDRLELEPFLLGFSPLLLALVTRFWLSDGVSTGLAEEGDDDEYFVAAAAVPDDRAVAAAASGLALRSRSMSSSALTFVELDSEAVGSLLLIRRLDSGYSLEPLRGMKWARECTRSCSRQYCGGGKMVGDVLTLEVLSLHV